jgi:hypothetical protein
MVQPIKMGGGNNMLALFTVSLLLVYEKRRHAQLRLIVDLETKDTYHNGQSEYESLMNGRKYTDIETTSSLVMVATGKPNTFLARIGTSISKGKIHHSHPVQLPLKTPFCANYAIGPNETFIRLDEHVTLVADNEKVHDFMVENSTHILSGHHLITKDIFIGECGGEIRFTCIEHVQDGSIVLIDHFNFQSSVFDYPDILALNTTERFGIDSNLLKTNDWEIKGRKNKKKHLEK